jgi:hypothetical protein
MSTNEQVNVFEVRDPSGELRFETLSQTEAEQFGRAYYSNSGVICNIDEVQRTPVDHRKQR